MQFINNGPDIPDALLQAHEEGRVVFFCGAGISYPAGLPLFKELVEDIYRRCGTAFTDLEKDVFERNQYDATLDLLERRFPGQRLAVRRKLQQALQPKLHLEGATETHEALLRLARSPKDDLRMVTTNFDSLFQVAGERMGQEFQTYAAPTLPIPKNSRWNGLVHLHGILPDNGDDTALNRLVVTSGDFGLAYLTEGWAARFVTALFQNYTVCFVGYRIGDPVLRYMMDALAADRMMGEVSPQAWVLGDCWPGEEDKETIAWKAKGVTPILYTIPAESTDHSALHKTLRAWADTYRDGVQGKEAIVAKYAMTQPQDSTQQDDFVGRILWALSDKTGLPAKRFADFNPAPSLDWFLEVFVDNRFRHIDLVRFGVPPQVKVDPKLLFSFASRPASYEYAPAMQLVSEHTAGSRWDDRMYHLARWLVRHLDDHRLIIWIANNGGQLHYHFRTLIEKELDHFAALERGGQNSALNEIRLNAPKAIPRPAMRTLWQLLLGGRVKPNRHNPDMYAWHRRLLRDGMTTTLRLELRELLAPKIHWRSR